MSNLMSSNRDEGRIFKNVERFDPSLTDVKETADLSNDTPADVFTNSRSSMKSLDVNGHNILSNKLYGENVCEPKNPIFVHGSTNLHLHQDSNLDLTSNDDGSKRDDRQMPKGSIQMTEKMSEFYDEKSADVVANSSSRFVDASRDELVTFEKCVDNIHPQSSAKNLIDASPGIMVSNFQEFPDKTSGGLHEGPGPLIRPNAGNVMGDRDILSDKSHGQGPSCLVSRGMKDESPSDRPPEPHDGLHDTKCAFGSREKIENDPFDKPPVPHDNEFDVVFEYEATDGPDGIASSPQGAQGFESKNSPQISNCHGDIIKMGEKHAKVFSGEDSLS